MPEKSELKKLAVHVDGITCRSCVQLLEKTHQFLKQVKSVRVDMGASKMVIWHEANLPLEEISNYFKKLGYPITPEANTSQTEQTKRIKKLWLLRVAISFASALATMHVSLTLYAGILEGMAPWLISHLGYVLLFVSLPTLTFAGWPFYVSAWAGLKSRTINLDVFVTLSIFAGLAASLWNIRTGKNELFFDAITMLIFALQAGRYIVFATERKLMDQDISSAWDPTGQLKGARIGDTIEVLSAQTFPCDGTVLEGSSSMNMSFLTGEETPVPVSPNSPVFCGAINLSSPVKIRIEKLGDQTRAGKILQLLTGIKKSHLLQMSHTLEKWIFAAVGAVVLYLIVSKSGEAWGPVVSILMVTCPCALGLAAPAVFVTALNQGHKLGILIKDGEVFERLTQINHIVFDKTGTLTESGLSLSQSEWHEVSVSDKARILSALARATPQSSHEVSKALSTYLKSLSENNFSSIEASQPMTRLQVKEFPGMGVEINDPDQNEFTIRYGKLDFVFGPQTLESNDLRSNLLNNNKNLAVALNGRLVFSARHSSPLRAGAKDAIPALFQKVQSISLLSGDNSPNVNYIAKALGDSRIHVFANHTPEMKHDKISELEKTDRVMMVGDGINDALALKKAHIGLAFKGGGASLEFSDIYFLKPDVKLLPQLFFAADRIRKAIFINMAWAVAYNILGITLVLKGVASPILCAIIMPLSSVTVISLSVLRKYFRSKENQI